MNDAIRRDLEDGPAMLTSQELADLLRVTRHTIENYRRAGTGPTYVKLPGAGPMAHVRYPREEVISWLEAQSRTEKLPEETRDMPWLPNNA
jgi:hypothetical protein